MAVITNSSPVVFGTSNADTITANYDGADVFGFGGNDDYYVNAFYDYANGSFGSTLTADIPADIVHEDVGGGIDTVHVDLHAISDTNVYNAHKYGSTSYMLDANIENLKAGMSGKAKYGFELFGNDLANSITAIADTIDDNVNIRGYGGNDTLIGSIGNDSLDGGTGKDNMTGGAGNDLYIVDNILDKVVEAVNAGDDSVNSSVSFTLGLNIENLTLSGSDNIKGTGNALGNFMLGNNYNNTLSGLAGNDSMDGGNGKDTLSGGAGNDTLSGGAGNDTLSGGAGNDVLYGGSGVDKLDGGAGDDLYINVEAGEVVTDSGGTDSMTTYGQLVGNLATGIENLTLLGSSNYSVTGNTLANTLIGNSGNNLISGLAGNDFLSGYAGVDNLMGGDGNDVLDGGTGADLMNGGNGNDTYIVDNVDDSVVEANANLATGGTDLVFSNVTFHLGENVENLTLLGNGNINGYGHIGKNILIGNSGNNYLDGASGLDTFIGGAGSDTLNGGEDADSMDGGADDDYLYSYSGNDTLNGGSGNDSIRGGTDNDLLDGGTGQDSLYGGVGNDTYIVDDSGDIVYEADNSGTFYGGTDIVKSSVTFNMSASFRGGLENLTLTGIDDISGRGNGLANTIIGNNGNNALYGGAGNDTLSGGLGDDVLFGDDLYGSVGADKMTGGAGNDTYLVNSTSDIVIETANGGTDRIYSALANYTLGTGVEHLFLYNGALNGKGNSLNNIILGTSANNLLEGLAGNDTLDGGMGNDTMKGGAGNDTYYIDSAMDVVNDTGGTDTVISSINYTLLSGFENLTLSGSAHMGTGNSAANIITGNSGVDTLAGGGGNDTYIVDNTGDIVTELSGGGTDLIKSSVSFSLANTDGADGHNVEKLTLTGSGNINATGSANADVLTGNDGNNSLIGGGGNDKLDGGLGNDNLLGDAGNDTMTGGAGNDIYYVDAKGDKVIEVAGGGADTVISTISYTLGANVENLRLSGEAATATGNGLDNLVTGNSSANTIHGGAGNDDINGYGGNDILFGDAGADSFDFDFGGNGVDTIKDFVHGTDKIGLWAPSFDDITFDGAGGSLTADQFFSGDGATNGSDAEDRIIYDTTTGFLYYDADGNGAGGSIQFAEVHNGASVATLTSTDIFYTGF